MPLLSLYNDNADNWKRVTTNQILELESNLKRLKINTYKKNVAALRRHIALNAYNSHNKAWSGEMCPEDKWTFFTPRGYVNGSFRYLTLYLEEQALCKTQLLGRTSPISSWW